MELYFDHEGLHRCWANRSYPAERQHSAEPESLGRAEVRGAGWQNACIGDWLLLGNQSAFSKQQPEIQPNNQRVRDGDLFIVIKPVFLNASTLMSWVFFRIWAAALTLLTIPCKLKAMDWDCPTTSLFACFSSLALLVTSTCTAI